MGVLWEAGAVTGDPVMHWTGAYLGEPAPRWYRIARKYRIARNFSGS